MKTFLKKASEETMEAYTTKDFSAAANNGINAIDKLKSYDSSHPVDEDLLLSCCVLASFTGQSLEKLDRDDEAIGVYRWIIGRGCGGMLPFTRLAILLERRREYEAAIGVCDAALSNDIFDHPTREGAQREFSKRRKRLEAKAATPKEERKPPAKRPTPKRKPKEPVVSDKPKSSLYAPYQSYFAEEPMSPQQLAFYREFVRQYQHGIPLNVEGSVSYIFSFTYGLMEEMIPKRLYRQLASELVNIGRTYEEYQKVWTDTQRWAADALLLEGDARGALEVFPEIPLSSSTPALTTLLLNIRLFAGAEMKGHDLLTMFPKKITKFGLEHIDQISEYCEILLREWERENRNSAIEHFSYRDQPEPRPDGFPVFLGTVFDFETDRFAFYEFESEEMERFAGTITREAENTVREEMGIPKIGEGWIAEIDLYHKIDDWLCDMEVIHHARPDWLGSQHLDIYIPAWKVAVEYQGLQHDQPVEFFGGDEALKERQILDARKMKLCTRNGIRLIYVREGYDFEDLRHQMSPES